MNRILIMGPPGSGKGTQAERIAAHHGIPAISTGDIFRRNITDATPLGDTARGYLERGDYVPDSVTIAMVRDRLAQTDCRAGFVLDGFPRTLAQIDALDDILAHARRALRAVVALDVDVDELTGRLLRRAASQGRGDDTEELIRRRQELYRAETAPLLEEYERRDLLARVDGSGTPDEVTVRVFAALGI